jgi:hypothetical protein
MLQELNGNSNEDDDDYEDDNDNEENDDDNEKDDDDDESCFEYKGDDYEPHKGCYDYVGGNNDRVVMCNNSACIQHCCNFYIDNCNMNKLLSAINNDFICYVEDIISFSCETIEIPLDIIIKKNMSIDNRFLSLSHQDRFCALMVMCYFVITDDDLCMAIMEKDEYLLIKYYAIFAPIIIISMLCLLMTFIVYSICPELRNMHGYALRSYVVSLIVVYTIPLIEYGDLYKWTYPGCVSTCTVFMNIYYTCLINVHYYSVIDCALIRFKNLTLSA